MAPVRLDLGANQELFKRSKRQVDQDLMLVVGHEVHRLSLFSRGLGAIERASWGRRQRQGTGKFMAEGACSRDHVSTCFNYSLSDNDSSSIRHIRYLKVT